MKKILIVIVVIIIAAVGYWLYQTSRSEKAEEPEDKISKVLIELKQEVGISFSDIKDVEFAWYTEKDDQIVQGKGFGATRISDEEFENIGTFFTDKGFEVDLYNVTAGTISGMVGYRLALSDMEQTVCHFIGGTTGYKEAEGQWISPEPDLKDVEIECGKTEIPDETADWQVYTNDTYGYSLKYPENCLYGPLPGYCKQSPPEERPQECRCFLNGTDPNSVLMQTFTGPKDQLNGASFTVFHSIYVDHYSPPAGTDLVEWIKEHYSYYEDIPEEINMGIDGIPAVKVYTPFSGMAWSQEDIYFIKNGKVFQISMLDVDNEDNRALYNQILSTFRFSEDLEDQTIETKNGESFSVVLEANPTTGYEWLVDLDSTYLELVEKKYVPDSSELIGSGGEETFEFLAKKSGVTEITFSYLRPWESVQPIEKKIYEIIIE